MPRPPETMGKLPYRQADLCRVYRCRENDFTKKNICAQSVPSSSNQSVPMRTPANPRVRLVRHGGASGEPLHVFELFSPTHHHSLKAGFLPYFAGFSLGGGVLGVLRTASHWFAQRGFLCNVTWLFASKPSSKSHCFLMIFIFEGSKSFCTPT